MAMATESDQKFPFEIKDVEPEVAAELMGKFSGESTGFVRVGPKGYFFPKRYEREAALYYNMPVRPSDVFVCTYPRSGTTLIQEMVWLIGNNLDYKKAAEELLVYRFPYLEYIFESPLYSYASLFDPALVSRLMEKFKENEEALKQIKLASTPATEWLLQRPSPRFIKSHLPLSLLPPALVDTARVVFVARDPRDVAVSFFHLSRLMANWGYNGDFKTYWNYFINDLVHWTPYFEFIKEAWEKRHQPNVLFLFYEELSKDMPGTIRRVSKFLEKPMTDEKVESLVDHLKIENFKNNASVNVDRYTDFGIIKPGEQSFIRKGKVGGWREYFDAEMARQAQRWIADNLRGSDLRFPTMDQ